MAPSRAAGQDNNFKLENLDEAFRKNYHGVVVLTTDGEADYEKRRERLLTDTFRVGRGSSRGWQEAEANFIYYYKNAPIKVVTKILATRLSSIISGLISDVQTAFLPNRQILDGPFIINELLSWCKHKKQQAMVFKVDFAKAYDSIRAIEAGIFKGIKIGSSLNISHLFYADDAVFIGEWSIANLSEKIAWIKWGNGTCVPEVHGGLGVSSFVNALNRRCPFQMGFWRFNTRDNSLWYRLIMSMHGSSLYKLSLFRYSTWKSIIREVHMLKDRGVDLSSSLSNSVDVRILLDECFLSKAPAATRWVIYVPIKINVFAWKVFLDRLPTRSNLQHRGVLVSDLLCPLCSSAQEDSSHLFFSCRLATDIVRLVCRWWNLSWTPLGSYADWLNWFNSIRLSSKVKDLLEGVLYITWWSVWMFRNQLLF
ncbi:RNA-directed DNA polymerase, eukaryota [Tanacetum coccineum]|uniref:RNA-directed DNA polymerase, eukaryota n=1 Tax=Tanacetum coccineum TaxID=301880 RepID=A0ABQ4Y2B2_9ASTR